MAAGVVDVVVQTDIRTSADLEKKDSVTQEHSAAAVQAIAVPTLVRSIVTLVFAACTIFIVEPSHTVGIWMLATWIAALGLCTLWLERRSARYPSLSLGALDASLRSTGYLALLGAACVVIFGGSLTGLSLVLSVVLVLMGLPELWIGITRRQTHPLGRDWLITGLVMVGAAIGVLLVSGLDLHAVLGVTGGAAIIAGVFLMISGLTLRHDAARLEAASGPDQP